MVPRYHNIFHEKPSMICFVIKVSFITKKILIDAYTTKITKKSIMNK